MYKSYSETRWPNSVQMSKKKMEHKTWENVLSEFNGARKEKSNPFYSMHDFNEERERAADAGKKSFIQLWS